jgi:hypothetical protein
MKQKKVVDKEAIAVSEFKTKFDDRGRRLMICENSKPGGKHWKGQICNSWAVVSNECVSVLCTICIQQIVEPPVIRGTGAAKSDKPKGWKFMKVFVTQDGTVYHKGEEQPALKGTIPATVIEPKEPKKKMTKEEKQDAISKLGLEIKDLKLVLITETRKGKRAEATRRLSKANRELKKLM